MSGADEDLRVKIIEAARAMNRAGINQGTSGNISARLGEDFLITPSGVPYESLATGDIVRLSARGAVSGTATPSSEWRMHLGIYAERRETAAILHAHSPYATALSVNRMAIPPFHYMVAIAGGATIRCARYATFGTQQLAGYAVEALKDRRACLLANHGLVCLGASPQAALDLAIEVETLAKQYSIALQTGQPVLLSDEEIQDTIAKFRQLGYAREKTQ